MIGALIGGFGGGLIGALIWVAVGYFLQAEIGYIAWGIGFLTGVGVRMGSEDESALTGLIAVLCAVVAIVGAKYQVVSFLVDNEIQGMGNMEALTDEDMIVEIADEVVGEYEQQGRRVGWQPGMTMEDATTQSDYPPDIWQEAAKRWNEKPQEERDALLTERNELVQDFTDNFAGEIKMAAFKESFNGFDLLWFGLAAFTAFRIGAGSDE